MPLTAEDIRQIANRCPRRWDKHYTASKLRTDPVYAAVEKELVTSGLPLLDVGCGMGLLAHWMRAVGHKAMVVGFDFDERKIHSAVEMARHLTDTDFAVGDARSSMPEHAGDVVILDILQYFEESEQDLLLRQAAQRVATGGKLVIRSGLNSDSWRYRVTMICDYIAHGTLWMKSAPQRYPTAEQFQRVLGAAGLEVKISPLWGNTPFNNHLIVAQRRE